MAEVDLHLHTTYSDGMLTPAQLVRLCTERGLKVISVTDHDSIEGIPEAIDAARALEHLTMIAGIELSADAPDAEVHMLGYFVDYDDPALQRTLQVFRDGRKERCQLMVEKLCGLGLGVSWERVRELSGGGVIGRPHIAQAMAEQGYVRHPNEAFDRYLGRDGLAYVGRVKLTPEDAVRMLVKNGALPVLAHPTYVTDGPDIKDEPKLRRMISGLKEVGLIGIEVYYKDYTPDVIERLAAIADELDLVPCGGSDYHASGDPDEPEPGSVGPPMSTVEALMAMEQRRTIAIGGAVDNLR